MLIQQEACVGLACMNTTHTHHGLVSTRFTSSFVRFVYVAACGYAGVFRPTMNTAGPQSLTGTEYMNTFTRILAARLLQLDHIRSLSEGVAIACTCRPKICTNVNVSCLHCIYECAQMHVHERAYRCVNEPIAQTTGASVSTSVNSCFFEPARFVAASSLLLFIADIASLRPKEEGVKNAKKNANLCIRQGLVF